MSTQNIIPKDCSYQCNTRIYWNTAENTYFEIFSKKKHICPNRSTQSKPTVSTTATTTTRPNYFNKFAKQPKIKMSNSLELLSGSIDSVQKQYEILSDLVIVEYNGKVQGSQSYIGANNSIQLIVYYEVPLGQRDEVQRKFANMIRNTITLHQRNY